ncbi:peptidase inhibitor family I36 protein [Streptomyces sp. NPDC047525]|uniref:peptidase inhibitor family I36 protein n=1 Tax=Streptomyces sp. NPDC047525 TaxID=3155264 RepID=UPI0033D0B95C
MRKIHKVLVCATATAAVAGGSALTAVADSAPRARSTQSSQVKTVSVDGSVKGKAAPSSCKKGRICFYTGKNYAGKRCSRSVSFKEWGSKRCRTSTFKSGYNNGYSGHKGDVAAYAKKNWKGTRYVVPNKAGIHFSHARPIRSVQWF